MSGIVNKVKEAMHGNNTTSHSATSHSAPEGTYGPHGTRTANAADPRIDSDADHRGQTGLGRTAGHGETGTYSSTMTSGVGTGTGAYDSTMTGGPGPAPNTAGPHRNDMLNKADPRVDSDMDSSRNMGASGTMGATTGHRTGGTGLGTSNNTAGAGTTTLGAGSGATGYTGTHGASEGAYGPHGSRVANAADPRVDSDRDGRANVSAMAPGPAPNTAGPHKQDWMNKADPRVDSDMDGSKTMGGNRTYQ